MKYEEVKFNILSSYTLHSSFTYIYYRDIHYTSTYTVRRSDKNQSVNSNDKIEF